MKLILIFRYTDLKYKCTFIHFNKMFLSIIIISKDE